VASQAGSGMRLLCVGDIHLGRQPSRLGEALLARVDAARLGPAEAWRLSVEHGLAARVDGVLLAGDVVEQENDFFEAYNDLRAGVDRLAAAGIPVLAVAGNHDVQVLPRLADAARGLRLLGRGGRWESQTLHASGEALEVFGWSFPEPVVRASPLAAARFERGGRRAIGLLHCDRDQPGSRYAPVASAELEAAGLDAWLLGHVHRPDPLAGPRPIGYLGSLTGLDPGEQGARGPWLLDTSAAALAIEHVPLAPLRWEEVEVPLADLGSAPEVTLRITRAIDALHERIAGEPPLPRAVGCRLRLSGRTPFGAELEQVLRADDPRQSPVERDGIMYFVHALRQRAEPAMDLEALARGSDPAGLLARRLLALRDPASPERARLLEAARPRLARLASAPAFRALDPAPPEDEAAAELLEAAALRALDALLRQRETPV